MANMHIMTVAAGGLVRVVCHIPTPNENNAIGVPLSTAVIKSGFSKGTTAIPAVGDGSPGSWTITQAEKDAIAAGTVIETTETFDLDGPGTLGAKLDARYAAAASDVQKRIRDELAHFGRTR